MFDSIQAQEEAQYQAGCYPNEFVAACRPEPCLQGCHLQTRRLGLRP
jgi:hypothetical protein